MNEKKIIMLASAGSSTVFMFNGIRANYPISSVIIEEKLSTKKLIQRKIKRLGVWTVLGQTLFQLLIVKFHFKFSKKRILEIEQQFGLDNTPIPESIIKHVTAVNSPECIAFLKEAKPDLVIVNGTRILSKKILNEIKATFVNTHVGITPKYRGVHGGYWALVNNDKENCGVTVHLIDEGIDTGGILYQMNISPQKDDNLVTYPYLQIAKGIECMKLAINDFSNNQLKAITPKVSESILWYHPTLWQYVYNWIVKHVK